MSEPKSERVPQAAPGRVYDRYSSDIDAAIARVLRSGRYVLGQEVERFEQNFASYVGTTHGIGVASGTDALELALRACQVAPGDLVFVPAFAPSATAVAVLRCGARIVLVDIDRDTLLIDPHALNAALAMCARGRDRFGAILPVHLFGASAPMAAIMEIARRFEVAVVEDCCQAHGTSLDGRHVGGLGRAAAFSFYPTKNQGGFGDGGMVVTSDRDIAERVRAMREYGWHGRYISDEFGVNSRLDEVHASALTALLPYLDARNTRRRQIASDYADAIVAPKLRRQRFVAGCLPAYHQFVLLTDDRDALCRWMSQHGVDTAIHYPAPLHHQRAFRDAVIPLALTESERAAREIASLPAYPELTDQEVRLVRGTLEEWIARTVLLLA
jgi:dTDP-4-amino-4,6-dideoxygalactose transaminase